MMWWRHPTTKDWHLQAADRGLSVCGRPYMEGQQEREKQPSTVCSRCKSGPDYTVGADKVSSDDEYIERIRKANTTRLPLDPKARVEELKFHAQVESVRKAFDAEVLA